MDSVADLCHSFIVNANSPPKGFEKVALGTRRHMVSVKSHPHCVALRLDGTKCAGLDSLCCSEQTACHPNLLGDVEGVVGDPDGL